jgi:hypothetical protein
MVSSRRSNDRPRRRPWELLLLLLALLMSLSCVFFATWLALRVRPNVLDEANMLPKSRADYRRLPGEEILFAPLDPALGIEAATDVARLARTPVSSATPAGIVMLPPTPTVTPTPTPALVATRVPVPTASPVPTATDLPTPTRPPSTVTPTVVPPTSTTTATRAPTLTPVATDTPVATPTWLPTDTPIPTSTPIPTDTPVPPTPTVVPTDTPEPTPTPTPTEVWPIVQAILPNTMVNTDTVTVTITGLNFQADCSVSLGSVLLVGPTCMPTMTIVASVPEDMVAGYYDLTVTNNADGRWGTLPGAYTATNPIPLVTGITPAVTVIDTTDLAIDISGDYFRNTGSPGGLRANLGTTDLADLTFVNSTMLTATVPTTSPVMALGAYTLTVTNPGPTDPSGSLVNAFTVYTYAQTCDPLPICNDAVGPGEPSGTSVNLMGSDVITIDFGAGNGITDGSGYDMIFYEWPNLDIGGGEAGILLDYVRIELSRDEVVWYTVFEWDGDDPGDVAGTNINSYANDAGPYPGESENEPIPWYDLYPAPSSVPHNSGIAIDIGVAAQAVQPPQAPLPLGQFRWVRVSVPAGSSDAAQIDAIVCLN